MKSVLVQARRRSHGGKVDPPRLLREALAVARPRKRSLLRALALFFAAAGCGSGGCDGGDATSGGTPAGGATGMSTTTGSGGGGPTGCDCPIGAKCDQGACPLSDLTIDAARILASATVEVLDFAPDACEIAEGCVGAPGKRTLLRFDLSTPNIGAGDLDLGPPANNDLFQYSPCHGHYHFQSFAEYSLLGADGQTVAVGHKQAFCLEDVLPNNGPSGELPHYTCDDQGVQAGWSDLYEAALPCQWVDVTGVPPGDYTLHVAINFAGVIAEERFDNNTADVLVTVPFNSCPNGCEPVDAKCCKSDDPCGWAKNGRCDCGAFFAWDDAECAMCVGDDPRCAVRSSCPAGCSANSGSCCAEGDPCGLANNSACDCEDAFAWDDADCHHCDDPSPPCPVNTCDNGCTAADKSPQCCQDGDPCGWAGDGFCDCGGLFPWDGPDCAHCTTNSPDCPP